MARRRTAAKKTSSSSRKSSAKKTSGARKSAAKKTTARKSTTSRKTSSARKSTAKKSSAKRSTAKSSAKKSSAKKSGAKRTTARRKTTSARAPRRLELSSLRDVLVDHLAVLRDGERQLVAALPKVARAATNPALREAVEHHLEETRQQAERLDTIFGRLRLTPPRKTDEVMAALVADAQRFVEATGDAASKDAALIAAAQRVEHYEIAGYGTARTLAGDLDLDDARSLLQETLDEESNADSLLTSIATGGFFRSGVNEAAAE